MDVDFAGAAISAVADEQARIKAEVQDLTDGAVSSPSKRDELLVHILMEYGVSLPDMRADTLRRRLDDPELPDPVKLLLALRLEATKTSTAGTKPWSMRHRAKICATPRSFAAPCAPGRGTAGYSSPEATCLGHLKG